MAIPVIMPRQGQSVESCIISEWFVKKGDKVKEGDLLFSYETDKAAFEEAAKVSGTVLEIFCQPGDDVPVLTTVCVIGEEGEDYSALTPGGGQQDGASKSKDMPNTPDEKPFSQYENNSGSQTPGASSQSPDSQEALNPDNLFSQDPGEKRFISPRARNLAEKTGADLRFTTPTGPGGRIIERDVRNLQQKGILITPGAKEAGELLDQPPMGTGLGGRITTRDIGVKAEVSPVAAAAPISDYQDVKLSNIRRVIARTMHESLSQMAQLTLNISFDATEILNLRQKMKKNGDRLGLSNITLNDIVLYAVSRVLPDHSALNAHFLGDTMRLHKNVHMGIAVDTDRGLMVPTLFNANLKSLNQISIEAKTLAQECQKGTISPDCLKNGTFTVTNLGALGIESFTPVINPPQTAILGVNTLEQKFRERNGAIESYSSMSLSLSFDHRAVDGAPAARFLKDLKEVLENFSLILAK